MNRSLANNGFDGMADYFVSPTGSDTNNGTIDEPFETISAAHEMVQAGDTIFLRGGVHQLPTDTTTVLSKSGTQEAPIRLMAYQDETPILDGSDWSRADYSSGDGVNVLIVQTGDHWHVEGLEITGGPFLGYLADSVNGSVFKDLNVHDNDNAGFNLYGESSDNLIFGGEFHHNFDQQNGGQDADGIGIKFGSGEGNVIDGALVYNNSDDGLDLWNFDGSITIKNSQFFGHGFDHFGHGDGFEGNGNGLKLSGGDASNSTELAHVVHNNIAWGNRSSGFDYNASQGSFEVYNNTAFGNGFAGFFFEDGTHVLQNNLSFGNGLVQSTAAGISQISNSWNLPVELTEDDFISLDPSDPDFLRLAPDSNLIDAGTQAGITFNGSAPDLGAFEAENCSVTIVEGDDCTVLDDTTPLELIGGAGNDTLIAGAGNDTVLGGNGDDTVYGGAGSDVITGGNQSDELHGGDGGDVISGGPDASSDTIYGDAGADQIGGGGGNDLLFGGDQADIISGGDGQDTGHGGSGNDTVAGGGGHDSVNGDDGLDVLIGGLGLDTLRGGDDGDRVMGNGGGDVLFGEAGNDTLAGGQANDSVDGGTGSDVLRGNGGDDTLNGGDGADDLRGDTGNDLMIGGNGDDRLIGGVGNDRLLGQTGNDTLNAGAGDDTIVGGSGSDQFVFIGGFGNDQITDFQEGLDTLVLGGFTAADVNEVTAGDDLVLQLSGGGNITVVNGVTDGFDIGSDVFFV